MRILHTADWHLGKRLDSHSRFEEQIEVMHEISTIAQEQEVDLVIVAGDLFDTFNPPTDAIELLYKTLNQLARNATVPVIAIAGNHDSPSRIDSADVLARLNGIIFVGEPQADLGTYTLDDSFTVTRSDHGFIEIKLPHIQHPVRVLHTPYANEVRLKEYFEADKQEELQESLRTKWEELAQRYCDANGYNLLTTHLFVAQRGKQLPDEPDGEKPLNIGGADIIYSDIIPPQIQYAALGHLHRYQNVGTHQPVIYSGSTLQYSFSEAGQQKYVILIDFDKDNPTTEPELSKIPLTQGKPLHRKTFDDIDLAVQWLQENPYALVELTIESETFITAEERRRLAQAHEGIVHIIPKITGQQMVASQSANSANISKDMKGLFTDYFKMRNDGQNPSEEILSLFDEVTAHTSDDETQ